MHAPNTDHVLSMEWNRCSKPTYPRAHEQLRISCTDRISSCANQHPRSSPGLSRKDAGLENVKGSGSRNGRGASSGSATPAPLYPTTNDGGGGSEVEAAAIGRGANPIMGDGSEGIPLGLSKLGREDLEVGKPENGRRGRTVVTEATTALREIFYRLINW